MNIWNIIELMSILILFLKVYTLKDNFDAFTAYAQSRIREQEQRLRFLEKEYMRLNNEVRKDDVKKDEIDDKWF